VYSQRLCDTRAPEPQVSHGARACRSHPGPAAPRCSRLIPTGRAYGDARTASHPPRLTFPQRAWGLLKRVCTRPEADRGRSAASLAPAAAYVPPRRWSG